MPVVYNISADAVVANQFVEFGLTQSSWLAPTDYPTNYSNLRMWYKADTLLSYSYSQSQAVTAWPNSAPGYTGETMTFTGNAPTFNTGSILSGSASGIGAPSLHMSASVGHFTLLAPSTVWTTMILTKKIYGDVVLISGGNSTVVTRLSSSNALHCGDAGLGYGGNSSALSSDFSESIVSGFADSGNIECYEGKTDRGAVYVGYGSMAFDTLNYNGVPGDVAEICFWTNVTLTQAQITSLYDNYWRQRYFYEPLYGPDVISKTTVYTPAPVTRMSVSTGSGGSTIKASNQFIENSSYTKQVNISYTSNVTARLFKET
jgi:hypothetical protein